jgi:predicted alpha/beta-fold hydrolase
MKFQPPFLLKNAHIQTLYASFFRKAIALKIEVERFVLSDGDFVEAYWHTIEQQQPTTPIVILFHGLTGSFDSPYIQY